MQYRTLFRVPKFTITIVYVGRTCANLEFRKQNFFSRFIESISSLGSLFIHAELLVILIFAVPKDKPCNIAYTAMYKIGTRRKKPRPYFSCTRLVYMTVFKSGRTVYTAVFRNSQLVHQSLFPKCARLYYGAMAIMYPNPPPAD